MITTNENSFVNVFDYFIIFSEKNKGYNSNSTNAKFSQFFIGVFFFGITKQAVATTTRKKTATTTSLIYKHKNMDYKEAINGKDAIDDESIVGSVSSTCTTLFERQWPTYELENCYYMKLHTFYPEVVVQIQNQYSNLKQLQLIEYNLRNEAIIDDESILNNVYNVANWELEYNKWLLCTSSEIKDWTKSFLLIRLALVVSERQFVSFLFHKHVLNEDAHVSDLWSCLTDHLSLCLRTMIPFECLPQWWKAGWQEHAFTINDNHENHNEVKPLSVFIQLELNIIEKKNPSSSRIKLEVSLKNKDSTETCVATTNPTTPTKSTTEKAEKKPPAVTESAPPSSDTSPKHKKYKVERSRK